MGEIRPLRIDKKTSKQLAEAYIIDKSGCNILLFDIELR